MKQVRKLGHNQLHLQPLCQEEIKAVTVAMLNRLIDRNHNLAVVFLDENTQEVSAGTKLGQCSILQKNTRLDSYNKYIYVYMFGLRTQMEPYAIKVLLIKKNIVRIISKVFF